MKLIIYSNVTKSDLSALLGCSPKRIEELKKAGLPCEPNGHFVLSKVLRWREQFHAGQLKQKILLSKLRQKELIELTGKSRQTIFKWCKKGLPQNKDGTFDLSKIFHWLPEYYDRVYKQKHQRIARKMGEVIKDFMQRNCESIL